MVVSRNIVLAVLLGVSLFGVSGAMLYLLLRTEDEDTVFSSQDKCRKLRVPCEIVPSIIGRGGANIKEMQQNSGARINFNDDPDTKWKICVIRGRPECIRVAEGLVQNIVDSHIPSQESFINIPVWAVGRVIGRGGEMVRDICHTTGAKVQLQDRDSDDCSANQKKIVIKGTPEQIKMAKETIEQIVATEVTRRNVDTLRREPRRQNGSGTSPAVDSKAAPLTPEGAGTLLEVFVSAVSSPSRFWLQIVGPQVQKLDKLVDEMTDYYSNSENRELHKLTDIQVGQLVAAVFRHDGKWYRAKVAEIKQNEFDGRQQVCDVHFVDYGDNEYVGKEELLALRTDLLQLRFQAVECFLAGAAPAPAHGPRWHPKAIERFEELTQVARWKRLWSRTCVFRDREAGPGSSTEGQSTPRGTREGSPIPGVKLYDVQDGVEIDVGDVLVTEGWAIPQEETPVAPVPTVPEPEQPMPPSFGDLQSSRVLGMVIGPADSNKREERAISLPHGGMSPQESPVPDRNISDDNNFLSDNKPKSSSLAAGLDHSRSFQPPGPMTDLSYAPPAQVNGSSRISNGTAKQNGAFINMERESVRAEKTVSPNRDLVRNNPESFSKAPPLHMQDPKDDLKAKMNRVDSHHGNLESLGISNPPPLAIGSPPK